MYYILNIDSYLTNDFDTWLIIISFNFFVVLESGLSGRIHFERGHLVDLLRTFCFGEVGGFELVY